LLQLLLIYKLKIKIVLTTRSVICSLFSSFFICGFCISHPSSSSFVKIHLLNSTCTLFLIYWHLFLFFRTSNSMYL
jgi:hypothetical protein